MIAAHWAAGCRDAPEILFPTSDHTLNKHPPTGGDLERAPWIPPAPAGLITWHATCVCLGLSVTALCCIRVQQKGDAGHFNALGCSWAGHCSTWLRFFGQDRSVPCIYCRCQRGLVSRSVGWWVLSEPASQDFTYIMTVDRTNAKTSSADLLPDLLCPRPMPADMCAKGSGM